MNQKLVNSLVKIIQSLPAQERQMIEEQLFIDTNQMRSPHLSAEKEIDQDEKTLYDKFEESGLIGFCSIEEDLSGSYKKVIAETLESKYDNR